MCKFFLGMCLSILMLAGLCAAQERLTRMSMLHERENPANLIEITSTMTDFLQSAKLKNTSDKIITGYRIGWVVPYPSGKGKLALGLPVDVPEGIRPGEIVHVSAQEVSVRYAKEGATSVVFFVTDVRFSSGAAWEPGTAVFETKARDLERKAAAN